MKILILVLFSFFYLNTFAMHPDDFAWKLKIEKEGIKIFTAPRHQESGIVPIKANTIIHDSIPRILTVLADTQRKKEWIPKLIEARIIEEKSKYERVEYTRYDSPWPLDDRSFVVSSKGRYNPKEQTLFIDITSVEHTKVPHNPDHVRGKTYIGSILLKTLGTKKTFFEMTLLNDFKGNVPSWIINMVQKKWPFKFFKNLKEQLAKEDIKVSPDFQAFSP